MNKYYNNLAYYIAYVILPYIIVNEILYLHKYNKLNTSTFRLISKTKKIINIKHINYLKIEKIVKNILITKYNYKVISINPIRLSYVIN